MCTLPIFNKHLSRYKEQKIITRKICAIYEETVLQCRNKLSIASKYVCRININIYIIYFFFNNFILVN